MASKIYRGFLFSRLELAVLLLSAGRKKIVGPRLPHKEEVSDISMMRDREHSNGIMFSAVTQQAYFRRRLITKWTEILFLK